MENLNDAMITHVMVITEEQRKLLVNILGDISMQWGRGEEWDASPLKPLYQTRLRARGENKVVDMLAWLQENS